MPLIQSAISDIYIVNCTPHASYIKLAIYFNGQLVDFSSYGWLVTYYSMTIASNKQTVPSLGDRIYIYSFGMLPMAINVGGIIFPNVRAVTGYEANTRRPIETSVTFDPFYLADLLTAVMVHETTTPLVLYLGNLLVPNIQSSYRQVCFLHKIRFEYKNPVTRIGGFMLGFVAGRQVG